MDLFDHFEPSCVGWGRSCSEPLNTALVDRITERSMTFCSSRTFPGHECRTRAFMNSSEMPVKCLQVLREHVGVKTFRRTPVLVNKPDIGIIDGPVQIIVEASGF
jgi:hypothetical protein